jgi:predicted nucleic acid-binding protein
LPNPGGVDATATTYARLRIALKKLAKPIPENDLWIAAVAAEHGLPLATRDAHFSVVPGLTTVSPAPP